MQSRKRKLTTEQVLEARLRFASGEREWGKLSRDYGVSRETIKSAVVGETFKELPMPPKRVFGQRPFPYG
ncbi:helix-turn-helix domain-containing protein [Microvirga lotononidis]|uniref:hypothetical protein n=1 Tax=Microvirga lotononidis TaxID=864069 RepID=UPI0003064299|nr:hypothetical protein [Microvirga lotononidis]WQO25917.1 hypothetical protein U0023_14500 [Microvirga lotononidis]